MKHYQLGRFLGACTTVDMTRKSLTKNIKKVDCPECLALEKHFRGHIQQIFCYSRNDLIHMNILK